MVVALDAPWRATTCVEKMKEQEHCKLGAMHRNLNRGEAAHRSQVHHLLLRFALHYNNVVRI